MHIIVSVFVAQNKNVPQFLVLHAAGDFFFKQVDDMHTSPAVVEEGVEEHVFSHDIKCTN